MSRKKRAPKAKKVKPAPQLKDESVKRSSLFIPLDEEVTDRHALISLGGPADTAAATEAFHTEAYLANLSSRSPALGESSVDEAATQLNIPIPTGRRSPSGKK